jgi:hypothetical protein
MHIGMQVFEKQIGIRQTFVRVLDELRLKIKNRYIEATTDFTNDRIDPRTGTKGKSIEIEGFLKAPHYPIARARDRLFLLEIKIAADRINAFSFLKTRLPSPILPAISFFLPEQTFPLCLLILPVTLVNGHERRKHLNSTTVQSSTEHALAAPPE